MKWIPKQKAELGKNSEVCKTMEYSFEDPDLDLGIATINGRFPDKGYAMNEICKELIYVLEGEGFFHSEDKTIKFSKD